MTPPPAPTNNPTVIVTMDLATFNRMQAILATRPFEEISELIFFFRNQVQEQLQRMQAQTGPRLVGDAEGVAD